MLLVVFFFLGGMAKVTGGAPNADEAPRFTEEGGGGGILGSIISTSCAPSDRLLLLEPVNGALGLKGDVEEAAKGFRILNTGASSLLGMSGMSSLVLR